MLGELGLKGKKSVAFVGAGGKTTAVYTCVKESLKEGNMAVALTTTKMWKPEKAFVEWKNRINFSDLENIIINENLYPVTIGQNLGNGKIGSIPLEDMLYLQQKGIRLFIEADGARGKWVKMPDNTEPVVPEFCDSVIGILNQKAIGETFLDAAHRPEFCAEKLGKDVCDKVEFEDFYRIWMKKDGIFQNWKGNKKALMSGFEIGKSESFYKKYQDIFQTMNQQELPVFLWEKSNDRQRIFIPDERVI